MNESPSTIHEACKRVKTIIANKKGHRWWKVSFQERVFTLEEENRVTGIDKKWMTRPVFFIGHPVYIDHLQGHRSGTRQNPKVKVGPDRGHLTIIEAVHLLVSHMLIGVPLNLDQKEITFFTEGLIHPLITPNVDLSGIVVTD